MAFFFTESSSLSQCNPFLLPSVNHEHCPSGAPVLFMLRFCIITLLLFALFQSYSMSENDEYAINKETVQLKCFLIVNPISFYKAMFYLRMRICETVGLKRAAGCRCGWQENTSAHHKPLIRVHGKIGEIGRVKYLEGHCSFVDSKL